MRSEVNFELVLVIFICNIFNAQAYICGTNSCDFYTHCCYNRLSCCMYSYDYIWIFLGIIAGIFLFILCCFLCIKTHHINNQIHEQRQSSLSNQIIYSTNSDQLNIDRTNQFVYDFTIRDYNINNEPKLPTYEEATRKLEKSNA